MNLIWTDKAEEDFEQNILFLLDKWDEKVVKKFTTETSFILKILGKTPKVFQKDKKINVHFVPITKHVTLFYEIHKSEVVLLRFWNNYQNPRKMRL